MGEPCKSSLPPLPPALRPSSEDDDGGSTPVDIDLIDKPLHGVEEYEEDEDEVRDDLSKTVVNLGTIAEGDQAVHGASASGLEINNLVNNLYTPYLGTNYIFIYNYKYIL